MLYKKNVWQPLVAFYDDTVLKLALLNSSCNAFYLNTPKIVLNI